MNSPWVLVDGYSVVHGWPQLQRLAGRSLQHRREALIRLLEQYADHSGRRVTVVFDAYAVKHAPGTEPVNGVEIIFSGTGRTADDVIERLVGEHPRPDEVMVVSSDNLERQTVESLGARSMSVDLFELEVQAELQELARLIRRHGRPSTDRLGRGWLDG